MSTDTAKKPTQQEILDRTPIGELVQSNMITDYEARDWGLFWHKDWPICGNGICTERAVYMSVFVSQGAGNYHIKVDRFRCDKHRTVFDLAGAL